MWVFLQKKKDIKSDIPPKLLNLRRSSNHCSRNVNCTEYSWKHDIICSSCQYPNKNIDILSKKNTLLLIISLNTLYKLQQTLININNDIHRYIRF